jgi:hypothetical protein
MAIARISALASGALLLNGRPADLASIEAEFKDLQKKHGAVWYYRENLRAEPSPAATQVIELVIKYRLPVSFSTKADFSDSFDLVTGRSVPRQP